MPTNREKLQTKRPLQKPASVSRSSSSKKSSVIPSYKRPVQAPRAIKSSFRNQDRLGHSHFAKATRDKQVTKVSSSGVDKLAKGLLILGFTLLLVYGGLRINQEIQLSMVTPKVTAVERSSEPEQTFAVPTQIAIGKIQLNLPVHETAITNNIWEVSPHGASYLKISARPGEQGTIIMYGHNTRDRFGPIRWLSKGEKIFVRTADGKEHTYAVTKTMTVAADRIDVLTQEKGETLILYTCDGIADLQRFVLIAKPVK